VFPVFPVFPPPPVLPVLPVEPVPVPVVPLLPEPLLPPTPTGAAPPEADETGMVVVVDVGGVVDVGVVGVVVVVVVVVVEVDEAVPPAAGREEPVPTTIRAAAGAEPALCADGLPATTAVAGEDGAVPADVWPVPLDWVSVPTVPVLAEPEGTPALGSGTVVGVLRELGATGPWAERTCWPIGPAPILTPAMIDSAAATTAPEAMRRL